MAVFQAKTFESVGVNSFVRAKKQAALAIKINTDASGSPTARGYEAALAYLQPFTNSSRKNESLDAQGLIAGYGNAMDKLSQKSRDQNETVSAFKLQELDSYFTSADGDAGSFRDPGSLVGATSEALDNLMVGVINAIDEKQANGDPTTDLVGYMNELQKRSDTMRDLRNKFEKGELTGQTLDGFGYYVDSNPIDGGIRRAGLLPVGLVPDSLVSGYRRLSATAKVGGALLPVYVPASQNAAGEYTANVGGATWSGTSTGVLEPGDASKLSAAPARALSAEGGFNISDAGVFPLKNTAIEKGSFGKGFTGRDANGNAVESMFYRGADNKLYTVDQAMLNQFRQDPLLSQKLDGYIPQFSPTEMQGLNKEAIPFQQDKIGGERLSFAEQGGSTLPSGGAVISAGTPQPPFDMPKDYKAPASFFEAKNALNKPDVQPISSKTQTSTPDVIEQGKGFFRKVAGFFSGQ